MGHRQAAEHKKGSCCAYCMCAYMRVRKRLLLYGIYTYANEHTYVNIIVYIWKTRIIHYAFKIYSNIQKKKKKPHDALRYERC